MIGLVLVTHGRLAEEFRSALEHVVGPQEHLVTVSIGPDDELEKRRADIMAAIHAAGLSVPNDISIVGFDDVFAASQSNPGLTTIRQPFRKIGSTAVERLLLAKTYPQEWQSGPRDILLPVELIVRQSTSSPR